MWDWDDEDGYNERGHDKDLEEPEAVVNSGADALARRHPDGDKAHGQEEEADWEGNLPQKKRSRFQKLLSISSTFYENLFRQIFAPKKIQSQSDIREKLRKALLYKKNHVWNVSEIDPWCQFHQHFTSGFLVLSVSRI